MSAPDEERPDEVEPLEHGVKSYRSRKERLARSQGLAARIALAGSVGWLVVLPALLGTWCGRWLDERWGTGVLWTGAGVMVGAALGFALLFRALRDDARRGEGGA